MRRLWLALLLLAVSGPALAQLRVVSLAPSLSEIVVELDSADLLVGVLDAGSGRLKLPVFRPLAAMVNSTWNNCSASSLICCCCGPAV